MWFPRHGQPLRCIKEIGAGEYFGEISLVLQSKRTATIAVATVADIASLAKGDFDAIMEAHPQFAASIEAHFSRYPVPRVVVQLQLVCLFVLLLHSPR